TKTHEGTVRTLTVMWGALGFEDHRDASVAWYQKILEELGAVVENVEVRIAPPG
ncbi:MAG: hypothetical protein HKO65_01315, partial [Gemmatimonadetes bacterium]|nr:hypothetical protein [Gemmatimonadota bacterium]